MKDFIFEKLAKELVENSKARRNFRNNGDNEMAEAVTNQSLGIYQAVSALGFDELEFHEYYTANRSRLRKELGAE